MYFDCLMDYIAGLNILPKAHFTDGTECDAIFLMTKPQEVTAETYIVIRFNRLDGGSAVKHYAVEIGVYAPDFLTMIDTKDALIEALNFYNRPCELEHIAKFVFSNEGGIYDDEKTDTKIDKLYFDCKYL